MRVDIIVIGLLPLLTVAVLASYYTLYKMRTDLSSKLAEIQKTLEKTAAK